MLESHCVPRSRAGLLAQPKVIPSHFPARTHRGRCYQVTWLTWRDHLATCGPPGHILITTHQPNVYILTHMWGLKETGKYLSRVSGASAVWSPPHEAGAGEKVEFSTELTI